jgi:hypothetical protein
LKIPALERNAERFNPERLGMSENSVRWLTPLQSDTASHLAGMLDGDESAAATDAFLEAALRVNGQPAPAPPPELIEAVPVPAAPAPLAAESLQPMRMPKPEATGEVMIRNAVQGRVGLVAVLVPELPYPLWFRAGTPDAANAIASLSPDAGGGRIPYQPRRILEIGAGAGYRTVALARSFPEAEIISTEADPAYGKVAQLNTAPYRKVAFHAAPVALKAGRYDYSGRRPVSGAMNLAPRPDGPMQALTLAELTTGSGWDKYDTVIMTPDNISVSLLRANPWPDSVRMVVVHTGGGPLEPAAAAAYPEDRFLIRPEGEYAIIYRRNVDASLPPPVAMPLFDPNGAPVSYQLNHVGTQPWSFFPIHPAGFRLHPNRPGDPAPELIVSHQSNGYGQLTAKLRVGHREARPVRFIISLRSEPEGEEIFRFEKIVTGGSEQEIASELPVFYGPCRVVFSTEMAERNSNGQAWAEFLEPSFL